MNATQPEDAARENEKPTSACARETIEERLLQGREEEVFSHAATCDECKDELLRQWAYPFGCTLPVQGYRVLLYLDRLASGSPDVMQTLKEHVQSCPSCEAEVRDAKAALESVGTIPSLSAELQRYQGETTSRTVHQVAAITAARSKTVRPIRTNRSTIAEAHMEEKPLDERVHVDEKPSLVGTLWELGPREAGEPRWADLHRARFGEDKRACATFIAREVEGSCPVVFTPGTTNEYLLKALLQRQIDERMPLFLQIFSVSLSLRGIVFWFARMYPHLWSGSNFSLLGGHYHAPLDATLPEAQVAEKSVAPKYVFMGAFSVSPGERRVYYAFPEEVEMQRAFASVKTMYRYLVADYTKFTADLPIGIPAFTIDDMIHNTKGRCCIVTSRPQDPQVEKELVSRLNRMMFDLWTQGNQQRLDCIVVNPDGTEHLRIKGATFQPEQPETRRERLPQSDLPS